MKLVFVCAVYAFFGYGLATVQYGPRAGVSSLIVHGVWYLATILMVLCYPALDKISTALNEKRRRDMLENFPEEPNKE